MDRKPVNRLRPVRLLAGIGVVAWFAGWQWVFMLEPTMPILVAIAAGFVFALIFGFLLAVLVEAFLLPMACVLVASVIMFIQWVFEPKRLDRPGRPEHFDEALAELDEQDTLGAWIESDVSN